MRFRVGPLLILLSACASRGPDSPPPHLPIEGIWKSDRDLTLAAFRTSHSWSDQQWKLFSDPSLFVHLVQVYRGGTGLAAFEGECGQFEPLQVLETGADYTRIRSRNDLTKKYEELTLRISDDHLYVPINMLKGSPTEVFSRATPEEAIREHPCLASVLRPTPPRTEAAHLP